VDEAFDRVLPLPLEELFVRRYGPIPAIKETRQQGVWGTVGQTRTIVMADPGTMQERLVVVERPYRFGYVLDQVTGPMSLLVSRVDGLWSFEPDSRGTTIRWAWEVHPRPAGRPVMPVFARFWHGYARRSLAHLEELLTGRV
jgi:hypothetical protein